MTWRTVLVGGGRGSDARHELGAWILSQVGTLRWRALDLRPGALPVRRHAPVHRRDARARGRACQARRAGGVQIRGWWAIQDLNL